MNHHLITLMVFLPFLGALVQAVVPPSARAGLSLSSWITLGASLAASICGLTLVVTMQTPAADLQSVEVLPWVGSFAIAYEMGLDGLNVLMVLLISIIFPLLIASEWKQKQGARGMHGLLLILQSSLAGAVCAQDLFLLFFFWALSALPFYFLIGIWGGVDREVAAFRSIVTASIGNALFFAALILIYHSVDPHTFSIHELSGGKLGQATIHLLGADLSVSAIAFGLICAGLAMRAPIWPLHGWFTKAAEEAPASVFVALSAVTVPAALYIFLRLGYSLFPETISQAAQGIVVVGAVNLLMGGICAVSQRGLKLLLAFVSLSEVGLILIGVGSLSQAGIVGAIFQSLALGLGLAAFGLFAGLMVQRGGGTEFLTEKDEPVFGGVAIRAPLMALVAATAIASLLGFPGVGGFVGHALLMVGSYAVHPAAIVLALCALLLAAYYLFTMYRLVFLGKVGVLSQSFTDLSLWERAYLFPLVGCLVAFGMYPKPLLELVRPTVLTLLSMVK